jgi:hypothetical protein
MELTRFSEMLITAYQSIQCKITDDYICQDSLVAFWLALPLGSVDDTVLSHQMLRDNVGLDQPSLTTVGKLKKKKNKLQWLHATVMSSAVIVYRLSYESMYITHQNGKAVGKV